ncbi:MAG: PadR family transcriptional regulator [Candidatus Micrarchaeia archaeon]
MNNGPGMHHMHFMGRPRIAFGRRGWLRPMVIELLKEKPMNGAEIMDRLYEMSNGWWNPSPGAIYPLLEMLKSEGIVSRRQDNKYELTKKYFDSVLPTEISDAIQAVAESIANLESIAKGQKNGLTPFAGRIKELSKKLQNLIG